MNSFLRKIVALVLLTTFPFTQISWGTEITQMPNGTFQPVVDPLAAETTEEVSDSQEPEDFFANESPLSAPTGGAPSSRLGQMSQALSESGKWKGTVSESMAFISSLIHVYEGQDLQAAIDSVEPGKTIYLHAGTYRGQFVLKEGVNLLGESRESVVLDGGNVAGRHGIRALGNNTIENLTITGSAAYSGAPASAVKIEGNQVKVRNNNIINNQGYGIYVWSDVADVLIEGNLIKNNNIGIQLPKDGNVIRFNTVVENTIGINILGGEAPRIESNVVVGNTFSAIYEFSWGDYSAGRSGRGYAILENNTFFDNAWRASTYGPSIPPAAQDSLNGNTTANPNFTNPSQGDYSVSENSPAYGRGAFVPNALRDALSRAAQFNLSNSITSLFSGDVLTGWQITYPAGSIEKFYLDGTSVLDTSPPQVELISANVVNQKYYRFQYRVDGVLREEIRTLSVGLNNLQVFSADELGNSVTQIFSVEYQASLDLQVFSGGFQHFENGELAYQVFENGDRLQYQTDGSIDFFKVEVSGQTVRYLDNAANVIEIRDANDALIKTLSAQVPALPEITGALKVSLEGGLEAYYLNGQLVEVRTITGVRIYDLVLSGGTAPEILDAVIRYADGTADIIWNKTLMRRIFSDGTVVDFLPDGTVAREISGNIEQTYVAVYDVAGIFAGTRITSNQGDETIYDEKGILRAVYGHDGNHFIYDRQTDGENWVTELNQELSSAVAADGLMRGKYTAEGVILELQLQDGRKLIFQNGTLSQMLGVDGTSVNYSVTELNGMIQGLTTSRGNTQFTYSQSGFLSQIQTPSGTITRTETTSSGTGTENNQETVDLLLELVGGDTLTNFELDSEGRILNGIIEAREGIKQKIENGVLTGYETVDGRFYSVDPATQTATLTTWTFQDGMVVKYGGVGIQEILFPNKKWNQIELDAQKQIKKYVEVLPDLTERHFENGKLVKIILPLVAPASNGVEIEYSAGLAVRVKRPDGSIETVERVYNSAGEVIQIQLTSTSEMRSYSPEGDLLRVLTSGLEATVQDGVIAEIESRFGNVTAPVFTNNQLSGEMQLSDGRLLTVENGKLTRMVLANGTQIDYQNGQISRVENSEGIYNLIYQMNGEELEDVKVNWTLKNTAPVAELVTNTIPIVPQGGTSLVSDAAVLGNYLSLDGQANYATVSASSEWNIGAQDFTLDFWMRTDRSTGDMPLVSLGGVSNFEIMYYGELWVYFNGTSYRTGVQVDFNEWNHVAVVRSGDILKIYLNGKQVGAAFNVAGKSISNVADGFYLGYRKGHNRYFAGALDEVRLSTGARWTSNFTVPSAEGVADPNVLFLHHFDEINSVEKAPTATVVTSVGGATIYSPQGVFNDAYYFDGNGDALKVYDNTLLNFGINDFTIDFRVNFESIRDGEFQTLLSRDNTSDLRIARQGDNRLCVYVEGANFDFGEWKPIVGQWYHLALVRKNGQLQLYLNGEMRSSGYVSNQNMQGTASMNIGVINTSDYFKGMMDEFRISDIARWDANFTVPTQVYQVDGYTRFLHHMDDFDRAESGKEILKYGVVDAGEVFIGSVTHDANVARFGTESLWANQTIASQVNVPQINWGNDDFTVEGWFKAQSATTEAGLWGRRLSSNDYEGLTVRNGKLVYEIIRAGKVLISLKPTNAVDYTQWNHFAVEKEGSNIRLYLNGVQIGAGILTDMILPDLSGLDYAFGRMDTSGGSNRYWNGWMDELRISNSARYGAGGNPIPQVFEVDQNTLFLHHGEGQGLKAGFDFRQPSGEMSLSRYLLENPDSEFAQIVASRSVRNLLDETLSTNLERSFQPRELVSVGGLNLSSDGQSLVLNGTDAYAYVPGTNFEFGGGDFTWEARVSFDDVSNRYQTILSDYWNGTGMIWGINPGAKVMQLYDDGWNPQTISTSTWEQGRFYDVALVKRNNRIYFFKDGILQGSLQDTLTYNGRTDRDLFLGQYQNQNSLKGNLDQIRLTKGYGRYVSDYVVPQNYERDENTVLLFQFNQLEWSAKKEMAPYSASALSLGTIDLKKIIDDFERGEVLGLSQLYDPGLGVYAGMTNYNEGYISRNVTLDIHDNLPAVTADLIDMNGDGFLDRVFVDDSFDYWWVQLGGQAGFGAPEKWEGVDRQIVRTGPYYNVPGSLRFYEGRHPHVLGDLVDINGDGRPDRVLQKYDGSREWYVQLNNGHGFDAVEIWDDNIQAVSQWSFQATYASEVRDDQGGQAVQPLIADLIDLDGDGLLDRVVRPKAGLTTPNPYDHWFFQKNNGHGFDESTIWGGVDYSFAATPELGGALSWYQLNSGRLADVSDVMDMNGDGLPDRILLKNKEIADTYSAFDWYVQFNNGHGFDVPVLWDQDVRSVPNSPQESLASSLRFFRIEESYRHYYVDLIDVTGDGLPDRVTMDHYDDTTQNPQATWWVEVNMGTTFASAVAWTGIEGDDLKQSSMGMNNDNTKSGAGGGRTPAWAQKVSDLKDLNGDGIADRIYFKPGAGQWRVQYGTGSGFLPSQPMQVESVRNATEVISENYDNIHISFRAASIPAGATGKIQIRLLDEENNPVQTWEIVNPSTTWTDKYLALDKTKSGGRYLEVKWVCDEGSAAIDPEILIEDIGFTSLRPNASTEWLDYLLTESNIIDRLQNAAHENLAVYLGSVASDAQTFNWNALLAVENRIVFDEATGKVTETEKLTGEVSTVTYANDQATITTTLSGGQVTQITVPENNTSSTQTFTQTIHYNSNTTEDLTDDYTETATIAYGRIRSITRTHEDKSDLQYSYEFDSLGREITVVRDPDTGETEKYRIFNTQNGDESRIMARIAANGVETRFTYNDQGDLTRTEIVYMGRVRETFTHGKTSDGLHALQTEAGMTELYDQDGKLVAHLTPEGYRYEHTFGNASVITTGETSETVVLCDPATDQYACAAVPISQRTLTVSIPTVTLSECTQNCQTVHQVTLASYTDQEGNQASYNGSEITRIQFSGGAKLDFDGWVEEEITDEATGQISVIRRPKDVIIFHTDGSITEFRGGQPYSITSASGRVIDIQPDLQNTDHEPRTTLVNPSAAAEFHYAEAMKLWNQTVLPNFEKFTLGSGIVVQTEYTEDGTKPITRLFAEGAREIYDANGKIEYVVSESGEQLIDYDYESTGDLAAIHLQGSRRRLEQAILELKIEVAMNRYDALVNLAYAGQVARETTEGQYLVQRERLLALKAQIESQRNQVASIKVKGKSAKGMLADAMNQINAGLSQVNQALYQLLENRNQALENINQQTAEISIKIENETAQAYTDIATKEKEMQDAILTQEISPVVYHWYRKILGRDPSKAEYEAAKTRANYATGIFDLAGLKNQLQTSTEFSERTAEVTAIKSAVRTQLENFLALTDEQKKNYFYSLTNQDSSLLVNLTAENVQAILQWLDEQSLHFGQSAYIALENLLEQAGVARDDSISCFDSPVSCSNAAYSRMDLATSLILIDILTGTLTPIEKGDLVLSMFAMKTYAARFGVSTEGYAMTFSTLKAMYEEECHPGLDPGSCDFRLVAHVSGNHFIIITGVTTRTDENGNVIEEVHYTDPGAGKDGDEQVVITKEEFLKVWLNAAASPSLGHEPRATSHEFGYILSPRAPPTGETGHPAIDAGSYRTLSISESMSVRGAFFFLIPIIIGAIVAAVQAVVAAVVAVITAIVSTIAAGLSAIGGFLSGIGSSISGFFSSLSFGGFFSSIGQGLSSLGSLIFNAITFAPNWALGALGLEAGSFLGSVVFSTVLGAEFMGVGKLLEFAGVSPKITNIIVAGGKIIAGVGLVSSGLGAVVGLGMVSSATVDIFGTFTNVSTALANIIGIGSQILGIFAAGVISPISTGWELLKTTLPNLSMDLASAGVEYLGGSLGWDWRLTSLISMPISLLAGGAASGWVSPHLNIFGGIEQALFSRDFIAGLVSVGASIGMGEFGGNPLWTGLGSLAISGIVSGLIPSGGISVGSDGALKYTDYERRGVLQGMKDAFYKAFDRIAYDFATKLTTFNQLKEQYGVGQALMTLLGGSLQRTAIESLYGSVSDLTGYVVDQFSNHSIDVNYAGTPAKEVTFEGENGERVVITFDKETNQILRLQENGRILEGDLRLGTGGQLYVYDGSELTTVSDGSVIHTVYTNGKITLHQDIRTGKAVDIFAEYGKFVEFYADGSVKDGIIHDLGTDIKSVVQNGVVVKVIEPIRLEFGAGSLGGESSSLFDVENQIGSDGHVETVNMSFNSDALRGLDGGLIDTSAVAGINEVLGDLANWDGTAAGFSKEAIKKIQDWENEFYAVSGSPLTSQSSLGVFLATGAVKSLLSIGELGIDTLVAIESFKEAIRTGELSVAAQNYSTNWKDSLLTNPVMTVANLFGTNTPNLNRAMGALGNEALRIMEAFGVGEMVHVLLPYARPLAGGLAYALRDDLGRLLLDERGFVRIFRDEVPHVIKNGWTKEQIMSLPKGLRPLPNEYLPTEYIRGQLSKFEGGASYLVPRETLDRLGRDLLGWSDNAQYVIPKNQMDEILSRAGGDIAIIERELGIPSGRWQGKDLVRIDIAKPNELNLRLPSGNELGTNDVWLPGGQLPTGYTEAVVNNIPEGQYIESLVITVD